jgi:hypothetical protein
MEWGGEGTRVSLILKVEGKAFFFLKKKKKK